LYSLLFSEYWAFFPPGQLGCEVDHLSPSSAEVKNEESCASTAVCLNGMDRDNFAFFICVRSWAKG